MQGIILMNAYTKSAGAMRQSQRIADELLKFGVQTKIIKNGVADAVISNGEIVLKKKPDFVVYLDKDKYLSRMLEKAGIRLFNCAQAVELCDDKMLTYITLANNKIAIPDTTPAPLCYYPDAKISEEYLCEIEKLGYPLIAKKSFGSWGKEVKLVKNRKELLAVAEEFKLHPHLFQKYIAKACGQDTRVIVIGKKAIVGMLRKNDNDFRSNIELGGVGYPVTLSKEYIEICEKTAKILNLDYCGIDILEGEDGNPVVCEVNSNAFFNEAEKVTGVNIAGAYAKHIVNEMNK